MQNQFSRSASKEEEEWESDSCHEWTSLTGESKRKVLKAKQWVQLFLSIKEEGHQKKYVTPYTHAMVYHVPNIIRQYGNLKQFSCQGVEKHNDDAKRNYFSSNRWDAPADIMTEYRLEVLQEYSREKRAYTKRDSAYWHEAFYQSSTLNTAHHLYCSVAALPKHMYSQLLLVFLGLLRPEAPTGSCAPGLPTAPAGPGRPVSPYEVTLSTPEIHRVLDMTIFLEQASNPP
ncbi:hypothetical protein EMCRGX_G029300 [Ephydatia muelleri]